MYMKVGELRKMETEIQKGLDIHFENVVTGNIITQEQASKLKSIIHKAESAKKPDFGNTKIMNDHRYKIYMDSNSSNYINCLRTLVDNGNITQAQADEIIMK